MGVAGHDPYAVPTLRQIVLDCPDARALAEFYRELLALDYRSGDEPPMAGEDDPRGSDWLVLRSPRGGLGLAFQQDPDHRPPVWGDPGRPQQAHLDLAVPDARALVQVRDRALALGAAQRHDRSDDAEEPLFVLTDPAGHPFCVFVAST